MKIISESWFKRHRWTLLVFIVLVFRPHLTSAIRNHVVIPFKKHILHDQRRMPVKKKLLKPKTELMINYAGVVLLDGTNDTEDDGCSDEDGDACSTESEYYDTEDDSQDDGCSDEEDDSCESTDEESEDSDYSEDDGCSDDEGCESDDDSYSSDDSDYYEDDGCSCQSETVVYSDDTPEDYYNSTLRVRFSVYTGGSDWTIRIEDTSGKILYTLMRMDNVTTGNYSYSWSGDYYDDAIGQSRFILPGSYYVVLQRRDGGIYQSKKSFTYNSKNGFQVDGTSNYEISFMY